VLEHDPDKGCAVLDPIGVNMTLHRLLLMV
jgi:hypothetical protein